VSKRKLAPRRRGMKIANWTAPAVFALSGLFALPSAPADADVASLLSTRATATASWRAYMVNAPAGSIHNEELVFKNVDKASFDPASRGLVLPDGKLVAFSPDQKPVPSTPDEDRVTRNLKKGRLIAIDRIVPPKDFTAGSILDRRASLYGPAFSPQTTTVFAMPKLSQRQVEVAFSFREIKPVAKDYGVPVMLASLVNNDTADSLAAAYANPDAASDDPSPFDSILTVKKPDRFVPKIKESDHPWAANVLPESVFSAPEQKCLANAIYFESANEPLKGQAAVAQVVLNRVRNPTFPKTICGVVYQNEGWTNACQFSFACDHIPDIVWSHTKYKIAQEIALAVTAGKIYLPEIGDSTHYHAAYVRPNWAHTMIRVDRIGLHIFYRTRYGGWS